MQTLSFGGAGYREYLLLCWSRVKVWKKNFSDDEFNTLFFFHLKTHFPTERGSADVFFLISSNAKFLQKKLAKGKCEPYVCTFLYKMTCIYKYPGSPVDHWGPV